MENKEIKENKYGIEYITGRLFYAKSSIRKRKNNTKQIW